jgi:hypothetical protein
VDSDLDLDSRPLEGGGYYHDFRRRGTENLKNGEREVKKALHEESQVKVCSCIYYSLLLHNLIFI